MEADDLSVRTLLSREHLEREDGRLFTLYLNLVRVGVSISFAALGVAIILLLLFVPSLPGISLGRTGQVIIGLVSSAVSFRLYRGMRVSNTTVLMVGYPSTGTSRLRQKLGRNIGWRIVLILVFCFLVVASLLIARETLQILDALAGVGSTGFLAGLTSEVSAILAFSVVGFDIGLLIVSMGALLVIWSLLKPLRSFLMRAQRFGRIVLLIHTGELFNELTGLSFYTKPDRLCRQCFCTSFKLSSDTVGAWDYDLICANCAQPYLGVDETTQLEGARSDP